MPMSRLVRIELLKLRTTRLTFGLLAIGTALCALDAVLRDARAGNGRLPPLDTAAGLSNGLTVTGFAMLMAWVLGVTMASGEFRHQTATLTYLQAPARSRVLRAKMIASGIVGLAFGAGGAAATTAVSMIFVAARADPISVGSGTIVRYAVGAIVGAALLAALGAALGSVIRGQLGAVIGVLVWALFVESIVGGLFNSIGPFLPFTAATTLAGARLGGGGFGYSGSSTASPLPFLAAGLLVAAMAVAIGAVAAQTTTRRDVT